MSSEHICSEYIATHNGAPVSCACGHFSAAAVMVAPEGSDMPAFICMDCAAPVLRKFLTTCTVGGEPLTDTDNLPFRDGGRVCFAHAAEQTARTT